MSVDRSSLGFNDTRLDTWKSISQHLGRSSRTAQRWHAEYGLPVHHLCGDASSVFAYTDELDAWLRQRDRKVSDRTRLPEDSEAAPPAALEGKPAQPAGPGDFEVDPDAQREAAELVVSARRLWKSLSSSNLGSIVRAYRRAVDLDGCSARAFAGLAQALVAQGVLGNLHPSAALHPAEAALQRALEIDPGLFESQCASALLKLLLHRDWNGAGKILDDAHFSGPNVSQVLVGRSLLAIARGCLSEASEYLRRASSEFPLNSSIAELLCWVEYLGGSFESSLSLIAEARETGHAGAILDTVEALSSVLITGPHVQIERLESLTVSTSRNCALLGVLGFAYGQAGRLQSAREVLDSMTRPGLAGAVDFAYPIALTFLGIGDRNEALKWLEQSYKHGSLWSLGFKADPMLAELREGAAYNSLFGSRCYPGPDLWLEKSEDTGLANSSMPYSA